MAPPPDGCDPLILGGPGLEGGAYVGLVILSLATVALTAALWNMAGEGPWPILVVWPLAALVALRLLTARELRIAPDGVTVIRHLLGLRWSRRYGRARFTALRVRCEHAPPRHRHGDGTPEGELPLLLFTVALLGRPRLTLCFSRDADGMEAVARRAARLLELPAMRRGYLRRPGDGLPVRAGKGDGEPMA